MDVLQHAFYVVGLGISRLLDPAMGSFEAFDSFLRKQLSTVHVPYDYQGTVITVGWVLVVFMVFRALRGVLRVIFVLLAAMVLAKVYGALPPA